MKFADYLKEKKISRKEAAELMAVSEVCVGHWCREKRIPSRLNMKKIEIFSGGKVKPSDFYG